MIDTHCHLDNKQFDNDRTEATERAFASGMTHLVIPAIEPARFDGVLALANSDGRIFCGMGIHPHNANDASDDALARVEELSYGTKVRAIGEIGLDYHYDFAPKTVQHEAFRKQLRIAKRRKLPVIVHNRESDDDMMRILDEEQDGSLRGVLHCFSGTPEQAERAVQLGFHVSFTGNITFKTSTLSETVASVPMDKLMIETDAPYMSPVPHRGKRNEPAFVRLVAEKVAEIRSMTLDEVLTTTTATAQRFFSLSVIVFAFFLAPILAFAQTDDDDDDDKPVVFVNPFPKKFGFGGMVGFNTLTDITEKAGVGNTVSFPGQALSIGGNIRYYVIDALAIDAGFYSGQNFTPTIPVPGSPTPPQPFPNRFQAFDLGLYYTTNPGNVVNICFGLGASYHLTTFNAGPTEPSVNDFGFNVKIVSLGVNILTPLGLFYPGFDFHASFVLGLNKSKQYNVGDTQIQRGFLYSVPRVTLYWFPVFPPAK
jgi:TatD DNase family protein